MLRTQKVRSLLRRPSGVLGRGRHENSGRALIAVVWLLKYHPRRNNRPLAFRTVNKILRPLNDEHAKNIFSPY